MTLEVQRQQNYLNVIGELLEKECFKMPQALPPEQTSGLVNLGVYTHKNNLNAKNWVYGNITEVQYMMQVFKDATKYNQTNCPLDNPYVNPLNDQCFDCPQGLNFSLGERTCIGCPEG